MAIKPVIYNSKTKVVIMINDWSALRQSSNGIMLVILAVFTAFWLSGCNITASNSTAPSVHSDSVTADIKADPLAYQACVYPPNDLVKACGTKGGTFLQQGRLGCYQCVVSYTDAGEACQDSSDCQGKCKNTGEFVDANVKNQFGQCASDSSRFGCYQTIEKGVAQPAICVD